jgi:hypothetical protein
MRVKFPARFVSKPSGGQVMVRGSDRPATFGFVAPPSPYDKHLLIRAVGPGLKLFGLSNLLSQPTLKIIDSAGKEAVFAGGSDTRPAPRNTAL